MCCFSKGAAACPGSKVELFAAIRRDSVPVRLIGGQVRVLLHANDLVIFDGHQQVARHDRLTGRLEAHLELDHYLEALIRKVARRHSTRTSPRRGGNSCQQPPGRTHLEAPQNAPLVDRGHCRAASNGGGGWLRPNGGSPCMRGLGKSRASLAIRLDWAYSRRPFSSRSVIPRIGGW